MSTKFSADLFSRIVVWKKFA